MRIKLIICMSLILIVMTPFSAFSGTVNLPRTGQTFIHYPGDDGDIQAGVAWPEPRFTDNGDGTMTDNLTGLMWTKNATSSHKTWQEALDYCNNLTLGGYSDWRLPDVNELESLVNAGESDIGTWLNAQGFTNEQAGYYWSSTTHGDYSGSAWCIDMWHLGKFGTALVANGEKGDGYNVWPVRGGQCGSLDHSVICLPKTGQTKCSNISGGEISCAGTGQDGDI
jgi:hypothetical protein